MVARKTTTKAMIIRGFKVIYLIDARNKMTVEVTQTIHELYKVINA